MAQSWVDAVWSSSVWSGLEVVVYLVIVGFVLDDIPGDGRTWFDVALSYTVRSGTTVGNAKLG